MSKHIATFGGQAVRLVKLASVIAAGLSMAGCATVEAFTQGVKGSGKKAGEVRKVAAFHAIDFTGSGKVDYRIGSPQSVKVETDDNLFSHVETVVKDGSLRVGFKGNVNTRLDLMVTITAPSCDAAELSGSGDIRISGVKEKHFDAALTGSGKLSVAGSARETTAVVSGSGELDLAKLETGNASTQVTGSGSIRVAPTGNLNAEITGSGDIKYLGQPKSVKKQITGSGSISKG